MDYPILTDPIDGYSTQAVVSLRVARLINNNRIRLWFSTRFNPIDNHLTSNPLWIFQQLDTAQQQKLSNEKTKDLLGNLLEWINKFHAEGLISSIAKYAEALDLVNVALVRGDVTPRIFYLRQVTSYQKRGEPDEFLLHNHSLDDPAVLAILPPSFAFSGSEAQPAEASEV